MSNNQYHCLYIYFILRFNTIYTYIRYIKYSVNKQFCDNNNKQLSVCFYPQHHEVQWIYGLPVA